MSKLIYSSNEEYTKLSRYNPLRVITEGKDRYLETYNQIKVPISSTDLYHIVSKSEEGRLDIISNNYYGSSSYWWAIALANNFIDPFTLNEGTMIRIPSKLVLSDSSNEILYRRD